MEPTRPDARSCSVCSSLISARWVTSRPTMVVSRPSSNTRCAASGSAQMLNSAAGERLPSPIAPPIRTMRSGRASGCSEKRSPMFVSGPVGTSVSLPSRARSSWAMKSTACCGCTAPFGGGRSGPSSPDSPWTCAATSSSRMNGRSAPAYTGMSPRPANSSTRSAFAVVLSRVWFPETVVTATSSISGEARASRIAIASSWPGSQSRMMGVGVMR